MDLPRSARGVGWTIRTGVRTRGRALTFATLLLTAACGTAASPPSHTVPLPDDVPKRDQVLNEAGRRMFAAYIRRKPTRLLLDDTALRAMLDNESASRAASLRASIGLSLKISKDASRAFSESKYLGVCLQGARLAPAGPPLGLLAEGFVFDRALVVATETDGGHVAAWVEGSFVLTDQGFYAVSLERLETPRRDHADLELAPCDLEIGLRSPRPVVVQDTHSY